MGGGLRTKGLQREREDEGELGALACMPRRIKLRFSIMLKTRIFRAETEGVKLQLGYGHVTSAW